MDHGDAIQGRLRLSVRESDARIELAATETLSRCRRGLGIARLPLPIPVETWIEKPLGFRFGIASADELGEGVLGLARPTTGEILVSETLLEREGRYRFTCAHELGHMILHKSAAMRFADQELPHTESSDPLEREADRFAAALLMPIETLSVEIERARVENGLAEEAYPMLHGHDVPAVWLWRRCFIPALAARYGVSKAAAVYRCREVRLPGQRRLLRPKIVPLLLAPEAAVVELGLDDTELSDRLPWSPVKTKGMRP